MINPKFLTLSENTCNFVCIPTMIDDGIFKAIKCLFGVIGKECCEYAAGIFLQAFFFLSVHCSNHHHQWSLSVSLHVEGSNSRCPYRNSNTSKGYFCLVTTFEIFRELHSN